MLAGASQTPLPGHITGSSLLGTIKPVQSATSSTHHRFTDDDQVSFVLAATFYRRLRTLQ